MLESVDPTVSGGGASDAPAEAVSEAPVVEVANEPVAEVATDAEAPVSDEQQVTTQPAPAPHSEISRYDG